LPKSSTFPLFSNEVTPTFATRNIKSPILII
jgi:hypothetical protein